MVNVRHDWDNEDYIGSLNAAYDEYRKTCYGDSRMTITQIRETKQAFLSGICWLATRGSYCPKKLEAALRQILGVKNEQDRS